MRLALLINDKEYRSALTDGLSDFASGIQIDIICKGDSIEPDALIVTDVEPADIDPLLFNSIKKRTIFLSFDKKNLTNSGNLHKLFKYVSISRLLSEISETYQMWRGGDIRSSLTSRVIACCTDSDAFSGSRCTRVARQIIYRIGGSVIIIPLGYINEDNPDYSRDINEFARIIYKIRKGASLDTGMVSYTDSYGISRPRIPCGRNPIAYLDEDDLTAFTKAMASLFNIVILDTAGCYRPENLKAIANSDSIMAFETGRRRINFEELPGIDREKLRIIKADEESGEDISIDEYIEDLGRRFYGKQEIQSAYG